MLLDFYQDCYIIFQAFQLLIKILIKVSLNYLKSLNLVVKNYVLMYRLIHDLFFNP